MDVKDSDFNEKVIGKSSEIPVIVDFWADWCMPCKILGPVLEKVAKDYEGKVLLAKFNVQENPIKSQEYGIRGIPAVKMFKDGKVVSEFVGAMPEARIKEWLDINL